MVDWLVPILSASSACDSPARRRALNNSAAMPNSGASASYSALDLGVGEQTGFELFELDGHLMYYLGGGSACAPSSCRSSKASKCACRSSMREEPMARTVSSDSSAVAKLRRRSVELWNSSVSAIAECP